MKGSGVWLGQARPPCRCASWCATGRARGPCSAPADSRSSGSMRRRARARWRRSARCRRAWAKRPSPNRRACLPARTGHCTGSSASYIRRALKPARPPMSKTRRLSPSFAASRQARVLVEDRRAAPLKSKPVEAHAARDVADDLPVRARFARRRQKGALARDAALGIGDRAVLLAPAQGRQQHVRPVRWCRCRATMSEATTSSHLASARAHLVGVRQADQRIGGHDPHGLDVARLDRAEQVDGFQARLVGHARRLPEVLHGGAVGGIVELHVRRQHVRQAADFAPAHRVRLAGQRERPHAGRGRCGP